MPALPLDDVEDTIIEQWQAEVMPAALANQVEREQQELVADAAGQLAAAAKGHSERVNQLKRQRYKWAEMAMDGTVPGDIAREKQQELGGQLAAAEAALARAGARQLDHSLLIQRVGLLLKDCGRLYERSNETGRRDLNLSWFARLELDCDDDTGNTVVSRVERTPVIEAMQAYNPQVVGTPDGVETDQRPRGRGHGGVAKVGSLNENVLVELLRHYGQPGFAWHLRRVLPEHLKPAEQDRRPSADGPSRQRRLSDEEVQQLIAEYQAGNDMADLAKSWGVHRVTVSSHLRRAGVTLRRQGVPAEAIPLARRLYEDGWSVQRLGERFGCNATTVWSALKREGVRMREPWER